MLTASELRAIMTHPASSNPGLDRSPDALPVPSAHVPASEGATETAASMRAMREWFAQIADTLINECALVVNGTHRFRLLEIEFYAYKDGSLALPLDGPGAVSVSVSVSEASSIPVHRDVFAHRQPTQRECLTWYFHKRGKSFVGGTHKGLDVTFGDSTLLGGILLRSMQSLENDQDVVCGPCLLVDRLLKDAEVDSIQSFVSKAADLSAVPAPSDTASNQPYLRIVPWKLEKRSLLNTPRIGLTLKKHADQTELRYRFLMQPYRVLADSPPLSKGKTQTLVARLHQTYQSGGIASVATQSEPFAKACRWVEAARAADAPKVQLQRRLVGLHGNDMSSAAAICEAYPLLCAWSELDLADDGLQQSEQPEQSEQSEQPEQPELPPAASHASPVQLTPAVPSSLFQSIVAKTTRERPRRGIAQLDHEDPIAANKRPRLSPPL
ncbi:hypothetical protein CAOG_05986 [Capsaspora owczarzaki ATCC 30864]|uniref:Uncharacterized protein n=1 Tax=Capsaspora owczarzaki (strain ATCC 30864) TaxID=595528 RepID=A0A0D2VVM1_CAPO3|nr:hypothetical protein CAOG_05986 [Capsaspora owczarzaki ATCC 30864]KJE95537.1 hypothetical protein CAOG_005986 [Capsaspora owczarzaki ATCC 30864]|eukprot:XP_004345576.1 hypothetical protein CAOG_05986 [Capsaspora owczarzaki ATCC 30864]